MTAFVLGAATIVGAIATFFLFFQVDEMGWPPFFACLIATAISSALYKILEKIETIERMVIDIYNRR